ncbi:MAG TPA: HlyD family secretion protein [Pyrinomonadaceae bacterium]|jgi:membrane fusion protein (multidrug efflux system)|nr:HlyD family secretion protein [Pyrinomonadaceae bacterium]
MSRVTEEPEVEVGSEVVRPARAAADREVEIEDADAQPGPDIAEEPGPDIPDEPGAAGVRRRPLYRRPAFMLVAGLVLVAALVFGLRYWTYARTHESTDDAFIDGRIVQVSPKVSGYVAKLYVRENQEVKEGELIAELDARDFEARLAAARAALAAGAARQREAQAGVALSRATSSAGVQQARSVVRQAQTGVESARAAASAERSRIGQASSAVATAQANAAQARAQVAAAEAEANRANADVRRYEELFAKDEVSRQRLDQAVATAQTAAANLEAARRRVAAAEAQVAEARSAEAAAAENARRAATQIGGAQAGVGEALGRLAQAGTGAQQVAVSQAQAETAGATIEQLRAAVEQAEVELSYTKIYAPGPGRITRKAVEEGTLVQPGQPLMAVVSGDVWVTANFKETQLGDIRPGQSVEITVDAYPGKVFKAHVESIQAGTGSRFSMIPPENATGNYVKVVQRVPVRIVFDEPIDPNRMLAPGMSVTPEVKVG